MTNISAGRDPLAAIQLPPELARHVDEWAKCNRFTTRTDAIRGLIKAKPTPEKWCALKKDLEALLDRLVVDNLSATEWPAAKEMAEHGELARKRSTLAKPARAAQHGGWQWRGRQGLTLIEAVEAMIQEAETAQEHDGLAAGHAPAPLLAHPLSRDGWKVFASAADHAKLNAPAPTQRRGRGRPSIVPILVEFLEERFPEKRYPKGAPGSYKHLSFRDEIKEWGARRLVPGLDKVDPKTLMLARTEFNGRRCRKIW